MQPYGPYRHIKDSDLYPYLAKPLPAGVLEHKYVDASDDLAAYSADQCDRQAVTAQWAWDNLCDETFYLFNTERIETEPWVTIDAGMDQLTSNGHFVLCFGRTGEIVVAPEYRVFASKSTVQRILERPAASNEGTGW
jgi:hypothetical protein